ncbi:alpha/beta hydrolase [Methylobacillus arboreus]|uniref:alpha/beta hydrolase family protein n=1 Tax=Methylobacillus arboreus TaxID=755170 RepID=UPI001E327E85|nr:alpha/beta fold hydrolase [Methylobacillus arboreus]MCB5190992.1 alpha/beta hydrolase [Methylobacillus arboreus]
MFVGAMELRLEDAENGLSFPALVMYPTQQAPASHAFGPYVMEVSPDAPTAPGQYPLVLVSHGSGGSHLLYRTITCHLARHGYVVAMIEHPGNNRVDNQFMGEVENLQYRPRHLKLAADYLYQNAVFSRYLQPGRLAVVGHSMGGYAALALAGGTPWYPPEAFKPDYQGPAPSLVEVEHDDRIKALVLLAPATAWFAQKGALNQVRVPILMLSAEHDPYTPAWHGDIVLQGVADPALISARTVKNAGHFSFLSPFPAKIKNGGALPTTDPEGFDREQFHEQLKQEILAYLNRKLKAEPI